MTLPQSVRWPPQRACVYQHNSSYHDFGFFLNANSEVKLKGNWMSHRPADLRRLSVCSKSTCWLQRTDFHSQGAFTAFPRWPLYYNVLKCILYCVSIGSLFFTWTGFQGLSWVPGSVNNGTWMRHWLGHKQLVCIMMMSLQCPFNWCSVDYKVKLKGNYV